MLDCVLLNSSHNRHAITHLLPTKNPFPKHPAHKQTHLHTALDMASKYQSHNLNLATTTQNIIALNQYNSLSSSTDPNTNTNTDTDMHADININPN